MRHTMLILALILVPAAAPADDPSLVDARRYTKPLFEDDFSGAELGKEWKAYKSGSKIREGVLVGIEPPDAGHNSVNSVNLEPFGDVLVEIRFKFEGAKRFAVAFNDRTYKGSHAGHICRVTVDAKSLAYQDGKTGVFKNEIFERRQKSRKIDAATKKLLEGKSARIAHPFEKGRWYALSLRIQGDLIQALIDGRAVGQFRSEGIAHEGKRNVALVVSGREMHLDDLKIRTTP